MDLLGIVLFTLFIWALIVARGRQRSSGKLPPGPPPVPLIGNLHKLGDKPHQSLFHLSKTYGPIMTLKLGQITAVVFSSSTVAKEVLQTQDVSFSNRSVADALQAHQHIQNSVVFLPVCPRWRHIRKILNSHIFSNQNLDLNQNLRSRKIQELVSYVRKSCQEGVAVDIGRAAFTTSLNLLSNTIFSVDLADPSSDTAQEFKETVWSIMVEAGKPNLVDYFPLLRKLDPQGIRRRMGVHFSKMFEAFRRLIDQRLELRGSSSYEGCNDVLDIILRIIEDNKDDMDQTLMEHIFLDLFAAGTDTTSSSVEWAMTEILRTPETLSKAKAELEQTIGKGRLVEESDMTGLPYLQAIVKETFRLHPPVPFLVPRKVETDIEVCGYTVPKDAKVLVNAWAIGRDPDLWANPEKFVPERFLGSEIDVRGRNFELIPFGAGRRICPGLPLGIRMVYLMLGSLINSFDWELEGDIAPEDLDMEEKFGITLQKAQPLRAVPIHIHV